MKLLLLLFIIISCSSTKNPDSAPNCYFFLGGHVVKIKTQDTSAYLYSKFNNQDTFYWESLDYIDGYYLPDRCPQSLIDRAQMLLRTQDEL